MTKINASAKGRVLWIDILKAIAISAVVLNHLFGIVYTVEILKFVSVFAVPVFILLSGINLSSSYKKNGENVKYILNKFCSVFFLYILVSLVYHFMKSPFPFSIKALAVSLATFSASPPFYFFAIYLQLLLAMPILYKIFVNFRALAVYILIFIFFLTFFLNKTNINHMLFGESQTIGGVYINGLVLGANKILGGSHFLMFTLGVYISLSEFLKIKDSRLYSFGGFLGIVLVLVFGIEKAWSNPPNFYTVFYACSAFLLFFGVINLNVTFLKSKVMESVSKVGRNSLYIFLLHPLFISIAPRTGMAYVDFVVVYIFALLGPILVCMQIFRLYDFGKRFI